MPRLEMRTLHTPDIQRNTVPSGTFQTLQSVVELHHSAWLAGVLNSHLAETVCDMGLFRLAIINNV